MSKKAVRGIVIVTVVLFIFIILQNNIVGKNEVVVQSDSKEINNSEKIYVNDGILEEKEVKVVESKEPVIENKVNEVFDEPQEKEVENNVEPEVVPKVDNKKVVVIDPGHGTGGNKEKELQSPNSNIYKIKDPGGCQGVVSKVPEYKVTWDVSLKLKSLLEQKGVTVILTKNSMDESPGNIERAQIGNNNNADLAIRIHCDSASVENAYGATMLVPAAVDYAVNISTISKTYGQTIINELVNTCGMYNRGLSERSDLTGFNWSSVPVVLVELGFMSNKNEDALLTSSSYQDKLAEGLCNGIIKSLGI